MEQTDVIPEVEEGISLEAPLDELAGFVQERFKRAEDKKYSDEQRFLKAYHNYRGVYGPDTQFTSKEKSKVFIKVTKTKVLAAYGQIIEVLFGNSDFPISVDRTKLPEGVVESVSFDPQMPPGKSPPLFGTRDGPPLPPGATALNLGPLEKKLEPIKDRLQIGAGTTPTAVSFHPADVAAKKMEKTIKDQLEESGASKHLRLTSFEMALFGTGVVKGPMVVDKEYPKWGPKGEYAPVIKTVPQLAHVSVWNFYPDPDAYNMEEAEYAVQRHKMSKKELRDLRSRPMFKKDKIALCIENGPNYVRKYWETEMEDYTNSSDVERWEVLEYWGFVEARLLREHSVKVPRNINDEDIIQANIWLCGHEIIRAVINPFQPSRVPYYAIPYEINPYSFFGVGVAENMDDTQLLMNGFMRMAVDNGALSGNLVFEIDESNLVPGQDLEMYPGKIFRRQAGAPGQALFATEYPNVSNQNMMLFDRARALADESTGLPSYAHGQTGIQSIGRTSSGLSMLMNAASMTIKTVIKNVDDYLLAPLGKSFFAFNMQFNFDPEIKGDLEVSARGIESLMANEVRSQRLMQFLGVVVNPVLAPFAKLDYILREIAKSLDLDPDKVTNSMADAVLQAEMLKGMMPPQGAAPSGPNGPPGVADTQGSGNGNIGVGSVPTPGEQGFSANTGGMNVS
jgi:hypothetical protein